MMSMIKVNDLYFRDRSVCLVNIDKINHVSEYFGDEAYIKSCIYLEAERKGATKIDVAETIDEIQAMIARARYARTVQCIVTNINALTNTDEIPTYKEWKDGASMKVKADL
jgi:predicted secreted protein